ncbi:MAG: hypothetical protein ACI9OJ_003116 [Myxococcota bacterium]|jgi:hypothetical protein
MRSRIIMVLASAAFVLSCAPPKTPSEITSAWMVAMADGRIDDAVALTATRSAARTTALARAAESLTSEQKRTLRDAPTSPAVRTVEWATPSGPLTFEHQGGERWVVVSPLPTFDQRDTPLATARLMRRSILHNDFRQLLNIAPTGEHGSLTVDTLRSRFDDAAFRGDILNALNTLLDGGPGQANGEKRWQLRAGRHQMDLVKEADGWRVSDLR